MQEKAILHKGRERISLHMRITRSLYDAGLQAIRLNCSFFQCFLIAQKTRQPLIIQRAQQAAFLELKQENFTALYIHAAYWINLCSSDRQTTFHFLYKEVSLATSIGATHYVMHLGNLDKNVTHAQALENVLYQLNKIVQVVPHLIFILENSAYAEQTAGIALQDFATVFSSLGNQDRFMFCLDTAHAYSSGYDLSDEQGYEKLLYDIATAVGLHKVGLIHLNDTCQAMKSGKDQHEIPGQGNIGKAALQKLLRDERLGYAKIIMELPNDAYEQSEQILNEVISWLQ